MKWNPKHGWPGLALGRALLTAQRFAADLGNRAEPDWWLTPRPMIQIKLRETDAGTDVAAYVASLKAAGGRRAVQCRWQRENYPKQEVHGIPKDFEKWKADKVKATGFYYRLMIEHVKRALAEPANACGKMTAFFKHAAAAGQTYSYRTFIVVGALATVQASLRKLVTHATDTPSSKSNP